MLKDNVIQFQNVNCKISGKNILKGITLNVERGEIIGLLGRNGAGKTTLISLISGLRRQTSGEIKVLGQMLPSRKTDFRKQMGFVLQENALYEELSIFENLKFSAGLYNVETPKQKIHDILEILGLLDRQRQVVSTLSGGLKRRTAIARAFLHDPELFIIDEPTLGVDADARHAVWTYLRLLKARGKTVIIATNYLDEALALCDRVAVLGEGEILTIADPQELVRNSGTCIDIECDKQVADKISADLQTDQLVTHLDLTLSGVSLYLIKGANPDEILREFARYNGIKGFCVRAPDLSEVFKSLGRT
jgi:ABC-2 type transport system ATP-binding protein